MSRSSGIVATFCFLIHDFIIIVAMAVIPGSIPRMFGMGTGIAGLAIGGTLSDRYLFLLMMSRP